ncbi:hypothetical protein PS673_01582 [Pseudomonas fluorescens]|uniref:Uncharacterized protein n=1 Tax=Pseudomonas fluorescens TaxID=294 RepID=A0A5E6REZ4_PSEFL|nr:hypothetical protein PS673_01582 [Pseudomonas fluorescens]
MPNCVASARVRSAGRFACGEWCRWLMGGFGLLNCTRRGMDCNWCSAMGMSGGFIRGRTSPALPTESNFIPHRELPQSTVAPPRVRFRCLCCEYRFSNCSDKRIVHCLYSIPIHKLTTIGKAIEALLANHVKIIAMVNYLINIVRGNQNSGALPGGALKALPNITTKLWIYTGSRLVKNHEVCRN